MNELINKACEACRPGTPTATPAQIAEWMPQLPGWEIITVEGIQRLQRTFIFDNFAQALAFTQQVGALAETEQHHPAILTEWGKVTVTWWTHKIKGLHLNDFIMAAKTAALAAPR